MGNLNLNDTEISIISKSFNVSKENIKQMEKLYENISKGIKYQYLAHVLRTVEEKIGECINNKRFQIKCVELPDIKLGSAQYYENDLYIIYYPKIDEKQARVFIAHELGHLIIEIMLKKENPNDGISEPLSTIFGILTMHDKSNFYKSNARNYIEKSLENIVKDFSLLRNEVNLEYNKS